MSQKHLKAEKKPEIETGLCFGFSDLSFEMNNIIKMRYKQQEPKSFERRNRTDERFEKHKNRMSRRKFFRKPKIAGFFFITVAASLNSMNWLI